tara:strand:+ start:1132 stop:1515 length:384 start_codon:yes stop_codon:yes gene_type:complete
MAKKEITILQIGDYCESKVQELVKEAGVKLRNRVVELSPVGEVNGGTFKSNWQPPVYVDKGLTARIVNNTQNYGEAITYGENTPPSWGPPGSFKSRFGLPQGWPTLLAGKDVQNAIPSMWNRIVSKP